jgi:hypothetical protein
VMVSSVGELMYLNIDIHSSYFRFLNRIMIARHHSGFHS